jgi:hypothetical protein
MSAARALLVQHDRPGEVQALVEPRADINPHIDSDEVDPDRPLKRLHPLPQLEVLRRTDRPDRHAVVGRRARSVKQEEQGSASVRRRCKRYESNRDEGETLHRFSSRITPDAKNVSALRPPCSGRLIRIR